MNGNDWRIWGAARLMAGFWGRMRTGWSGLLTRDFFPEISSVIRRCVYHPLGVLVLAALVSAVCGCFLHAQLFVLTAGLIALMACGLLWPMVALRGVEARVGVEPARAGEGEECEIRLRFDNAWPWPAWGLTVANGFAGPGVFAGIAYLPGRSRVTGRQSFRPARRGRYPSETPMIRTGFPFGLWEPGRPVFVESGVIVRPRTYPVGPVPSVGGEAVMAGSASRARSGQHGDVIGVRPYRRGDSPRRIHWGQSAKHDRLIVCEQQVYDRPAIQIVVDVDPASHTPGPDGTWEWSIRVAASLIRGWIGDGACVGLTAGEVHVEPSAGAEQSDRLLDQLALLAAAAHPLDMVLRDARCGAAGERLRIVVTTDRGYDRYRGDRRPGSDGKWVILQSAGFGSEPSDLSGARIPAWLTIAGPADAPRQLRGGWSEARHGE
jgi:uncharacterized protein (DUF58 family)